MPTLIKLCSNWADEMDIEGFTITKDSKDKVIDILKQNYMKRDFHNASIELSPEDEKKYKKSIKDYGPCTVTITQKDVESLLSMPLEICIGTNEELYFEDFESYLDEHSIEEISNEEYDTIEKLFGKEYGHSPSLESYSRLTIIVKD